MGNNGRWGVQKFLETSPNPFPFLWLRGLGNLPRSPEPSNQPSSLCTVLVGEQIRLLVVILHPIS